MCLQVVIAVGMQYKMTAGIAACTLAQVTVQINAQQLLKTRQAAYVGVD